MTPQAASSAGVSTHCPAALQALHVPHDVAAATGVPRHVPRLQTSPLVHGFWSSQASVL